jgi:peptidoglycan/xylan/chitin deacetylase (PgdA/CDA1 family)
MTSILSTFFMITFFISGCSFHSPSHQISRLNRSKTYRQIASTNLLLSNRKEMQLRAENLMEGIVHGHLLGQVYLFEFDRLLNRYPNRVLKSSVYSSLLSVRSFVEEFEHELNELYLQLVVVSALPEYSVAQKENAKIVLDSMGQFLDGIKTDKKKINENLKPLILTNLMNRQKDLYEELRELHDDDNFTKNDPAVKKILRHNMVLLRATRLSYYSDLKNYKVNPEVLKTAIKEERRKNSFLKLEQDIKELTKEMKLLVSELDRGTSSDMITPSAGPEGNISGRTYPANTWSLTYDDGPGKTTPQIIDNLLERNIPATFFVLAKQVETNPLTTLRLRDSGFDIANHSYTHAQLTKVGPVQLEREIGESKRVIEEKINRKIKLFRLPYGAGVSVSSIRSKIAEHDMIHVFWTVDTLDWQDKNPNSILERALKQMRASPKNSGIILFHDIHQQSVIASTMLMDHFNKEKLTVCTVQGVVNQINQSLASCK